MTKLFLILALVPFTSFAADVRVTGAAAREIYDSLSIKPVSVIEEHTGMQNGTAKYGKLFGCERNLDSDSTYCWFNNSEHSYNGLIHGAVAAEFYGALGLAEVAVVDEHGNMEIAKAKYGRNFGCQVAEGRAECWFR